MHVAKCLVWMSFKEDYYARGLDHVLNRRVRIREV